MELCKGGPIINVTMDRAAEPLPEDKVRFIFRQLVLGIAYLHHNSIIHRDIKPDSKSRHPSCCLFVLTLLVRLPVHGRHANRQNCGLWRVRDLYQRRRSPCEKCRQSSVHGSGITRQYVRRLTCRRWAESSGCRGSSSFGRFCLRHVEPRDNSLRPRDRSSSLLGRQPASTL